MFWYFGFGSNINLTSLRAKGVEPQRSLTGTLSGWRVKFNVTHFFRHEGGVGNIKPSGNDDRVQGLVHYLRDQDLEPLDETEACGFGYRRITVPVETTEGLVEAIAYVGMPGFIDDGCRPRQRYLNIVLAGARAAGLDPDYIDWLGSHPVHQPEPVNAFVPPEGDWPLFDFDSLARHPDCTALYGHVFDMRDCRWKHQFLRRVFGGRDMTLFHLQRLDTSNGSETWADIAHGQLSAGQQYYLDEYLHQYAREYQYAGRIDYESLRRPAMLSDDGR